MALPDKRNPTLPSPLLNCSICEAVSVRFISRERMKVHKREWLPTHHSGFDFHQVNFLIGHFSSFSMVFFGMGFGEERDWIKAFPCITCRINSLLPSTS